MLSLEHAFLQPEPPHAVELRAFTHGLMPRSVPAMLQRFAEDWQRYGVDAWNEVPNHWKPDSNDRVGWWNLPEYLGDQFIAPLIGAPPGACILQPNVHWTVQCLLSAPEVFSGKKEVVITEAEFPSVMHSLRQWSALLGLRLRIVPLKENGFVDEPAVLEAIGAGTALVVLSHVGFTTGEKLTDAFLEEVGRRVHASGGIFAVDGYHATGSVPVQVAHFEPDLYFGGLLKEACGSSGNAYVYVRPGLSLSPRVSGWFGDADPFGFRSRPEPHPDVRRRFMGGTPAVASMYHAVEGVRLLLKAGLDAVRADSLQKTDYCIRRMEAAGLKLASPHDPERRSAMVIVEIAAADRLCAALKQRHIYTDSRKGRFLRLAPFVWNTPEALAHAFDLMEAELSSRRYLSQTPASAGGPVT